MSVRVHSDELAANSGGQVYNGIDASNCFRIIQVHLVLGGHQMATTGQSFEVRAIKLHKNESQKSRLNSLTSNNPTKLSKWWLLKVEKIKAPQFTIFR